MRNVHMVRFLAFGVACGILLLISAAPALAADIQQGNTVIIGPDEVVNDDVYAAGANVQILGTVNGDVFAAGNIISIGGTVSGGVFAVGNTISITGDVHQGVHVAGGTVTISGPVAQDAVLASGTFNLAPGGSVGRDVMLATGTAELGAPIGRDVRAAAGTLILAAPIGGDVQTQVSTLRLADSARVQGSLSYTSDRDAEIAPGASVGSGIQHLQPQTANQPTPPVFAPGWAVIDWVKGLVGLAIIGLLFTLLLPRFSEKTVEVARSAFWPSLAVGFALFIGAPIVAIVVFILGIIVGGWMLGVALLALYAMACAVGYTFAAILTGTMVVQLLHQPVQHLAWNLLEGLTLLGLIGLVPVVGGLVIFLACIFGLGAFALNVVFTYRASRPAVSVMTSVGAPPQPELAAAA